MNFFRGLAEAFAAGAKPAPARKQPKAERPFRPNPWPKCRELGCWHRVHPASIHPMCRRAWDFGPALPPTHKGGLACCPGICETCHNCIDRCEFGGNHPDEDKKKGE